MALSDYRLCDVCGGKAFYDASLNYDNGGRDDQVRNGGDMMPYQTLDNLGDWVVICRTCAANHKAVVQPRE